MSTTVHSSLAGLVSSSPTRRPIASVVKKDQPAAGQTDATAPIGLAPKSVSTTQVRVSSVNVSDERFHLSMIALLGCILTQLINFEDAKYPSGRGGISMFHTAYCPSITIAAYLKRIALYTKISTEVMIQSVLHVHQLMQRTHQPLVVNKLNIHRLLLTAIMSTAKFFDDAHYNNSYYSYVGGVPLKELNALEVEFLSLLNFDFYVSAQTYNYFYQMTIEANIHRSGCACASHLVGLPSSLPTQEYVPSPEIDWALEIPLAAAVTEANHAMEDVHHQSAQSSAGEEFFTPIAVASSIPSAVLHPSSSVPSSLGSAATSATITPMVSCRSSGGHSAFGSSASVTPLPAHVGSSSSCHTDEMHMSEELGSIRIVEEDDHEPTEDDTVTPMAMTPEATHYHREMERTPKQLTMEAQPQQAQAYPPRQLQQQQQYRSASPASFLSNSVTHSPVSSVGSYSSLASSSYRSRQPDSHVGHSPSISLSHVDSCFARADTGGSQHRQHQGEQSASYLATPKQTASATPRACSVKYEH